MAHIEMTETLLYSINRSKVVYDKFDDEVVLINLENGNYFSIRGVAVLVWDLFSSGSDQRSVVSILAQTFGQPREILTADVAEFIGRLLEEELMIVSDSTLEQTTSALPKTAAVNYAKPVLEVYSDMQDLILLDPIHEVDETGWPNAKKESEPKS